MSIHSSSPEQEFASGSEESEQLVGLLRRLRSTGAESPNLPLDIWQAITTLVPVAAVEVLISNDGQDFLLTMRQDEHWNGWHIPGGYVGCGESLSDACQRVARRELGIEVELQRIEHAFSWTDHPYAQTVSIVCCCSTSEMPICGKFFREIPSPMVPHHADILNHFLASRSVRDQ